MIEKEIKIKIENGLHARPSAELIKLMNTFKSTVYFNIETKKVNAKSILNLMGVSIQKNQSIRVMIDGDDEEEALLALEAFLTDETR
ncbi:HPr family phosphocarrier protein [Metabacillus litoralis]|uniref:HPr family phosphocarrier protein n=1 Tax=Metabacillus TaxID=2675233 RepID=UPI000EF56584|nr:HPr family phosphocarrier protein [Metabacillus litoralis]MCM3409448.1 HPr family phosphocarrier protein [Metabacillus litoralis]UHA58958.1 HPr family phosphocarrier protein [Metabacillus litoralis]